MPKFSAGSLEKLGTCDPRLQRVASRAIKKVDFKIIAGHRGKAQQDEAFARGTSKVRFPRSAHNKTPSRAFDFIPWPFTNWEDHKAFRRVADAILEAARDEGVKIVRGIDWGWDGGHIELDNAKEK